MEGNFLDLLERDLVRKDDLEALKRIAPRVRTLLEREVVFRTPTEMRISVLNDITFPTPDSKFWQSVREQTAQLEQLVRESFEFKKTKNTLQRLRLRQRMLERKLEECDDDLEREDILLQIEALDISCREKEFQLASIRRVVADRVREIKEWARIQEELEPLLEYGVDNPDRHQLVSYLRRFVLEVINYLETRPPGTTLGEIHNLRAHIATTVKKAREQGVLEKALAVFSPKQLKMIGLSEDDIRAVEDFRKLRLRGLE